MASLRERFRQRSVPPRHAQFKRGLGERLRFRRSTHWVWPGMRGSGTRTIAPRRHRATPQREEGSLLDVVTEDARDATSLRER